jgi:hypothetical protein
MQARKFGSLFRYEGIITEFDRNAINILSRSDYYNLAKKYKGRSRNFILYIFATNNHKIIRKYKFYAAIFCAFSSGISSHVLPSSNRPVFFLFTPPHCLKKNATPAF